MRAIQVQGDIYVRISNRYRGYEMRISWYEFFERENAQIIEITIEGCLA